jgi:enamine deaminase RidA (YjgF/YER057c/UK114 family)
MIRTIETGLPHFGRPTEWATMGSGILFTCAVPVRPDGSFETGDPRRQIDLSLANLRQVMQAAGGRMNDVAQVIVYLTDAAYVAVLNEVWAEYFVPPYPNRAIAIVSAIGVPGIVVMMQVHAAMER